MPTEMETITMPRGGARNRSGPLPSEDSARSESRGYKLDSLPVEGFNGEAPEFPLPQPTKRELDVWAWAWTTPQACAWAQPSERWRLHTIAMYVRTFVICEGSDATAADKGSLHRFADDIGLTPAGLRVNGWAVAKDELSPRRGAPAGSTADAEGVSSTPRLRDAE